MSLQNVPPDRNLIPSEKPYLVRLCKQAIKSTYEVSKSQQVLMTGMIAIIGIPVGLHFGLITIEQWWSYLLTAACTYGIALLIILFINFLRAPFILDREQTQKVSELSSRLMQPEGRSLGPSSTPATKAATETGFKAPDIEHRGCSVLKRRIDADTNVIEEEEVDDDDVLSTTDRQLTLYVVLARFYYKPDAGTPPWIDVKAHVYFYDAGGKLLREIFDAVWHKTESDTKTFKRAEAHQLIVCLAGTEVIGAYECDYEERGRPYYGQLAFSPKIRPMDGKEFYIQVELIAEKDREVVLTKPFKFNLTLEPEPRLELLAPNKELAARGAESKAGINKVRAHEELLPLLREGQQLERELPNAWLDNTRTLYFRCGRWAEQVDRTLRLYLDESFVARFHAQDDPAATWPDELQGRVAELEKIVRELRG